MTRVAGLSRYRYLAVRADATPCRRARPARQHPRRDRVAGRARPPPPQRKPRRPDRAGATPRRGPRPGPDRDRPDRHAVRRLPVRYGGGRGRRRAPRCARGPELPGAAVPDPSVPPVHGRRAGRGLRGRRVRRHVRHGRVRALPGTRRRVAGGPRGARPAPARPRDRQRAVRRRARLARPPRPGVGGRRDGRARRAAGLRALPARGHARLGADPRRPVGGHRRRAGRHGGGATSAPTSPAGPRPTSRWRSTCSRRRRTSSTTIPTRRPRWPCASASPRR